MSLDFWPGTEIRRSTHNGFTTGLSGDWSDLEAMSRARERSAALAERRRAAGTENSTIYGLSRKAEKRIKKAPAAMPVKIKNTQGTRGPNAGYGMKEDGKTGRIRAMLATGPKGSREIADAIGVTAKLAIAMMRNDIRHGRIVKIGTARPLLYALGEAAHV